MLLKSVKAFTSGENFLQKTIFCLLSAQIGNIREQLFIVITKTGPLIV
jgi:hypothetical protein